MDIYMVISALKGFFIHISVTKVLPCHLIRQSLEAKKSRLPKSSVTDHTLLVTPMAIALFKLLVFGIWQASNEK